MSHKYEDAVQVKFMRRRQKGLYEFSSEPEATHPASDIVKMTDPTLVYDGRALRYSAIKVLLSDHTLYKLVASVRGVMGAWDRFFKFLNLFI